MFRFPKALRIYFHAELRFIALLGNTACRNQGIQDGFGLGEAIGSFRKFDPGGYCNTYYLHGALHLFADAELDTLKRIVAQSNLAFNTTATASGPRRS